MDLDALLGRPLESGPTPRARSRGVAARASLLRGARDPSSSLLLAQLAVATAAFVANVLAARGLAPDGRGELALLLQIAYLSSLGLLLGADRSIVAVFGGAPAHVAVHAVRRLLLRPMLYGIAVTGATVAVLPLGDRSAWWLSVLLVAAFAVVNAFVRSMRSVAIAAGRHRDFVRFTVAGQLLLLATMALLLVSRVHVVEVWLVAYLVAGALPTLLCFRRWQRADDAASDAGVTDGRVRQARREGLAVLPAAVADSGMLRLDRLLLPALASTSALGIYAAVGTMTELLAWPLLAYADARLGTWRAAADEARLRQRRILVVAVGYVVVAGAVLTALIAALVVPLLGDQYEPARQLVLPLVAAAAVYGLSQVLGTLLLARRRGASASLAATVGFGVSALAYVLLIPDHGAAGAAYGSLIGYAASLVAAAALSGHRRLARDGERP
jgi:O-antigen/teichoic acid export membrane protein